MARRDVGSVRGGALGKQGVAALHGASNSRGEVIVRPRWLGSTLSTGRAQTLVGVLEAGCQLEVLVRLLMVRSEFFHHYLEARGSADIDDSRY